jgi:hypothetical protein
MQTAELIESVLATGVIDPTPLSESAEAEVRNKLAAGQGRAVGLCDENGTIYAVLIEPADFNLLQSATRVLASGEDFSQAPNIDEIAEGNLSDLLNS